MRSLQERLEIVESQHSNSTFAEEIKKLYEDTKKELPWYKRILIKAFENIVDALIQALINRILKKP